MKSKASELNGGYSNNNDDINKDKVVPLFNLSSTTP
jgi:hypothetical protein